jgi:tetratricopeptide (TPR) repeat protein
MRVGSIDSFEERLNKVNNLSETFSTAAAELVKIIVSELPSPIPKKTIKPISSNNSDPVGVYSYKDFIFKFARDNPQHIYGGESIAAIAVGCEWRALQELLSANVFHLHHPLMAIVDYQGFRVAAFAQIPLASLNEPVYGYSLAKKLVVNQQPDVEELMKQVGTLFNLKPHRVNKAVVDGPGDLRVHLAEDGRFYVVNTARLFPPVTPVNGLPGSAGVLYRHLRPEFLKYHSSRSLTADAFLNWGSLNPNDNIEVVEATQQLQSLISGYATALETRYTKENISLSSLDQQLNLSGELHERGINVRSLGKVYTLLVDRSDIIAKFILLEILTRASKHLLLSALRKAARHGEEAFAAAAVFFTKIFGDGEDSKLFWQKDIREDLSFRFELTISDPSSAVSDDELQALLFKKIQKVSGVQLNVGLSKVVAPENVQSIDPRIKAMKMNVNGNVNVLIGLGRFSDAEALIKRQLEARSADGAKHQKEMAAAIQALGELYSNQPERENEAEQRFIEAIAILERETGTESVEVARAVTGLGAFYRRGGKSVQATEAFSRALNIIERVGKVETGQICTALLNLGESSVAQGRFQDARPLFLRAAAILDKHVGVAGTVSPASLYCNLLVRTYHNMASLYCYQGQHNPAEEYCDRALAVIERMENTGISSVMSAMDQKGIAIVLDRLGQTYTDQQRISDAERVFLKAIDIAQKALGSESYHVATIMNNLAYLYSANGYYDDTENLYKTSISILEATLGPQHAEVDSLSHLPLTPSSPTLDYLHLHLHLRFLICSFSLQVGVTIGNLAVLYKRQGKFEDAAPLFERALEITKHQLGPDHPKLSDIYYNIHSMYFKQQKWDKALPYLEKSIAIDEKVFGPFHPEVLQSKMELEALRNKVVTSK